MGGRSQAAVAPGPVPSTRHTRSRVPARTVPCRQGTAVRGHSRFVLGGARRTMAARRPSRSTRPDRPRARSPRPSPGPGPRGGWPGRRDPVPDPGRTRTPRRSGAGRCGRGAPDRAREPDPTPPCRRPRRATDASATPPGHRPPPRRPGCPRRRWLPSGSVSHSVESAAPARRCRPELDAEAEAATSRPAAGTWPRRRSARPPPPGRPTRPAAARRTGEHHPRHHLHHRIRRLDQRLLLGLPEGMVGRATARARNAFMAQ